MLNRRHKKIQQGEEPELNQADAEQTLADVETAAPPHSGEEVAEKNGIEIGTIANQNIDEAAQENYDKYLRAVAELENYKRRAIKEKIEAIKFGNERLLADLLPVYDALLRAIEQVPSDTADTVGVQKGLEMLRDKFSGVLTKHGVEAIESLHKDFDPNFHEALLRRESDEFPHNTVVAEFEKGFILNGRLLRPARVEVCQNTNNK